MKAYRRLVVATDLSAGSRFALGAVRAIAKEDSLDIQLIHVLETMSFAMPRAAEREYERERRAQAEIRLNGLARTLGFRLDSRAKIRTVVANGSPADQICRAAEEARADLIIVGSHGRTGVRRAMIGSVAERVARHAGRPVLIVPLAGSHPISRR